MHANSDDEAILIPQEEGSCTSLVVVHRALLAYSQHSACSAPEVALHKMQLKQLFEYSFTKHELFL